MLPTDLPEMIAREELFQLHRQREHEAGRPCARAAEPLAAKEYRRFVVRDIYFKWSMGVFSESPVKSWRGDPACAILRSAGFLNIARSNPLLHAVTPQYLRLLELYRSPIPPVMTSLERTGLDDPNDDSDCGNKDGDNHSDSDDELSRDSGGMTLRALPPARSKSESVQSKQHNAQPLSVHPQHTVSNIFRRPTRNTSESSTQPYRKRRRLSRRDSPAGLDEPENSHLFGPHWTSEELAALWKAYRTPAEAEKEEV
jgi:hypothetical protein